MVGNAYTAADVHRSPAVALGAGRGSDNEHDVWIEMGLRAREKDVRMRCVFQYGAEGGGGSGKTGDGGAEARSASAPASGSPGSMVIRRVFLVREGLDRLPLQDAAMEVKQIRGRRNFVVPEGYRGASPDLPVFVLWNSLTGGISRARTLCSSARPFLRETPGPCRS